VTASWKGRSATPPISTEDGVALASVPLAVADEIPIRQPLPARRPAQEV
jgi:hypothetical protein